MHRVTDTATVFAYSDDQCSSHSITDRTRIFMGCAYHVQQYYYGPSTSTALQCSTGTSLPPLPSYDGSYILQTSYDSEEGCEEGSVSAVDAMLQDHCTNVPVEGFSYSFSFPDLIVFDGLDCPPGAESSRTSLNTDCQSSLTADNDYSGEENYGYSYADAALSSSRMLQYYEEDTSNLFNIWSVADEPPEVTTEAPTVQPVAMPSSHPTRRPSTLAPSKSPTDSMSSEPTAPSAPHPSIEPTIHPTAVPSALPTIAATTQTGHPSLSPTPAPSFLPSARPSAAPSHTSIPTVHPTRTTTLAPVHIHSSTNLTVHMQQTLNGISARTWTRSASKNALVFRSALAASLQDFGISSSHIIVTGVEDVSAAWQTISRLISPASAVQCRIVYDIVFNPREHGWSSASKAVSAIENKLDSAVQDDDFDTTLAFFAATWQAADLMHVTSSNVWVESVDASASTEEESQPSHLGGIIGGVVGGLMALVLLVGVAGYAGCGWMTSLKQQVRRSTYAQVSLETDSVHASINPIVQRQHRGVQEEEEEGGVVEIELGEIRAGRKLAREEKEEVKEKVEGGVMSVMHESATETTTEQRVSSEVV